jgi:hypothetical protein
MLNSAICALGNQQKRIVLDGLHALLSHPHVPAGVKYLAINHGTAAQDALDACLNMHA